MGKKGRNNSGEKVRWSSARKINQEAKLRGLKPADIQAEADGEPAKAIFVGPRLRGAKPVVMVQGPQAVPTKADAPDENAVTPKGKKAKKAAAKKRKAEEQAAKKSKKPKQEVVQDNGDVLEEANFLASSDEELEELKAAKERKELFEAQKIARGKKQVIVNGIPWSATEADVAEYFKRAGTVLEVTLPKNQEGRSRGFAFLKFETEEEVAQALLLHEKDWEARKISVRPVLKQAAAAKKPRKTKEDFDDDSEDDDSGSFYDDGSGDTDDERGKGKGKGKSKGKKGTGKGKKGGGGGRGGKKKR